MGARPSRPGPNALFVYFCDPARPIAFGAVQTRITRMMDIEETRAVLRWDASYTPQSRIGGWPRAPVALFSRPFGRLPPGVAGAGGGSRPGPCPTPFHGWKKKNTLVGGRLERRAPGASRARIPFPYCSFDQNDGRREERAAQAPSVATRGEGGAGGPMGLAGPALDHGEGPHGFERLVAAGLLGRTGLTASTAPPDVPCGCPGGIRSL